MAEKAVYEENASLQTDEIEALSAIYGEDWKVIDGDNKMFFIDIGDNSTHSVHLQVSLPETYPLESPPVYQFSAPWMDRTTKNHLSSEIEDIYCKHPGESILYMWIDKIREFITEHAVSSIEDNETNDRNIISDVEIIRQNITSENQIDELPAIKHGEPITDRRSVFQAHLAQITCVEQVDQVLSELKENKKIATATHNVFAYRISRDTHGTFFQDSEDDGENKAGSLLLHLLQILNVENIIVIVSRWYGGVHLGPDRFKHINNAARNLLDQCGYIQNEKTDKKPKKKK